MAALAFLTSVLYWPGVAGAAEVPRWAFLAFTVPWLLREQRLTAAHVAGGLFLAWAVITMAWNAAPQDGVGALLTLFVLMVCFCLGSQLSGLRQVIIGAGLGVTVSSALAIAQYSGYATTQTGWHSIFTMVHGWGPAYGLFVNGNYMAEAAALVLVAAVSERIWWLIPGLLPALVLPDARGAMLAAAVALVVSVWRSRWIWSIIAIAGVAVTFYIAHKGLGSMTERLYFWHSTWNGITLFGHGIGSFWAVYPLFDLRPAMPIELFNLPENAHNEFLTVAFETGIVGLVLFCAFCLTLAGPLGTARLVLIALFVESCFAFPIHLPVTGFLGMVAAGHAVRNRYLLRDCVSRVRNLGAQGLARPRLSDGHALFEYGGPRHAV